MPPMSESHPRQMAHQSWKPPVVAVGDHVLVHRAPGDTQPTVAIVNKVGTRTIFVSGFVEGVPQLQTWSHLSGVRHCADPDLGRGVDEGTVCWSFAPQTERVQALSEAIEHLLKQREIQEQRIAKLEELLDLPTNGASA